MERRQILKVGEALDLDIKKLDANIVMKVSTWLFQNVKMHVFVVNLPRVTKRDNLTDSAHYYIFTYC